MTKRMRLSGVYQLYQKATAGAATEEVLFESPEEKAARAVSPDGTILLFERSSGTAGQRQNDIWALPLTGDRTPRAVVATAFDENDPAFSPDGRWIAFQSDVSSTREVYAQAFPTPGVTTRISTAGGSWPQWTADGKTIVYFAAENVVMAVDIAVVNGELRPRPPRKLFTSPGSRGRTFAFDPVGRRFLIPVTPEAAADAPVTVVLNWAAALRKK